MIPLISWGMLPGTEVLLFAAAVLFPSTARRRGPPTVHALYILLLSDAGSWHFAHQRKVPTKGYSIAVVVVQASAGSPTRDGVLARFA